MRNLRGPHRWLIAGVVAGVGVAGAGRPATVARSAIPSLVPSKSAALPGAPAFKAERPRAATRRAPVPHADGPPLARTGGFGELTCVECHLDLELNAPGGALLLDGIPASFTPGAAYVVTVIVEGEGMGRAGFQAAARFNDGERAGGPAGRLAPLDGRTVVRREDGVDYINHTAEGSELGPGDVAGWSFEWIAPGEPSPVVFHVTGNSANGDNSPLGDLIYAAEVVVPPGG